DIRAMSQRLIVAPPEAVCGRIKKVFPVEPSVAKDTGICESECEELNLHAQNGRQCFSRKKLSVAIKQTLFTRF
ncbi:MAG: hypothetical protein ACPHF4_14060, partial [Rubripirellula sp.]